MTALRKRLLLVLGGVALGLGLAELALQGLKLALADRFAIGVQEWQGALAPDGGPGASARRAILCVGDSHTYGLGVQRELESYPVRLEVLLNGGDPRGEFTVLNLGVPGANTALAGAELERALAGGGFDLVLVLAGYNDEWNLQQPQPRAGARLLLPQLLRWIAFCLRGERRGDGGIEQDERGFYVRHGDGSRQYVNVDPGSRQGLFTGGELERRVDAGLRAIVATCRAHAVPVVLQTYASRQNDRFESASAGARAAAQATATPLVDHAAWFAGSADGVDPAALFQPDGHPTGTGYDQMARALHARLRELAAAGEAPFREWRIPPASEAPAGASPAASGAAPALAFEPIASDSSATVRFRVSGPPGGTWRLAFARSRGAETSRALGLALDDLFARSRAADGLCGRFDANGAAAAWAARTLFVEPGGAAAAQRVHAQLLLLDPYAASTDSLLLAASDVEEIDLPPVRAGQ